MMTEAISDRIQRGIDRIEIGELLSGYAHGTDRRDAATVLACFHEGATMQVLNSPPIPAAVMFSPDLYQNSGLLVTGHYMGNMLASFHGPDQADCQTSLVAYHLVAANGANSLPPFASRDEEYGVIIGARYFDRVERGDNGWRFRSRALTFDWSYEVGGSSMPQAMLGTLDNSFSPDLGWLRA